MIESANASSSCSILWQTPQDEGHDVNMLSLFVSQKPSLAHAPQCCSRSAHTCLHSPHEALQLCAMKIGLCSHSPCLAQRAHFVAFSRSAQLCSSHKSQLSGQFRNMKPGLTSHSPADAQLVQASLMSLHVGGHAPHETGQCKNM